MKTKKTKTTKKPRAKLVQSIVDDDLHRALSAKAARAGTTVGGLVRSVLRWYVAADATVHDGAMVISDENVSTVLAADGLRYEPRRSRLQ